LSASTRLFLTSLITSLIYRSIVSDAATISIGSDSDLTNQRDCVRDCIAGCYSNWGPCDLVGVLGCGDSNSCFCHEDLRSSASSFLSACVYTQYTSCSDQTDYDDAASIYDRYCTFTAPATVTAHATSAAQSRDPNAPVTITISNVATQIVTTSSFATETVITTSSPSARTDSTSSERLFVLFAANLLGFVGVFVLWRR
jgi:hypothetical protein